MSIIETSLLKAKNSAQAVDLAGARNLARPAQTVSEPERPVEHRGPRIELDLGHLRELHVLGPDLNNSRRAYEYRTLRNSLMRTSQQGTGPSWRLIAVTSALPNDGKTRTSFNLAMSFASPQDRPVLLVDADLAKRHLSKALGVESRPGLSDLLRDPSRDVQELLSPTDTPCLSFLPAGEGLPGGGDGTSASRMVEVVELLAHTNPDHVILFDTSPLLLTSEASMIAPAVGQMLLVIRAGVTPQDAAREALSQVSGQTQVSVVLNAWQPVGLAEKGYYERYHDYYGK